MSKTPSGTETAKLAVSSLFKRFGTETVLEDISFDIPTGTKAALIGPAASGKTVLMKCIAGIYPLTSGKVVIDGKPVSKAGTASHTRLMEDVGVLFQQGGLLDSIPVWKNICFKLIQTRGMDEATARKIAIEKLEMVHLKAAVADLHPAELSGGMAKRVGIARALAGDPSLLLLDEPTAGLDPITTSAINRLIDDSRRHLGATVLAITSNMSDAREHYDTLFMLNGGRLVWNGTTTEIDQSGNSFIDQMINGKATGPITIPGRAAI